MRGSSISSIREDVKRLDAEKLDEKQFLASLEGINSQLKIILTNQDEFFRLMNYTRTRGSQAYAAPAPAPPSDGVPR